MQRLASRQWPLGWHPGGLGWWLGRREEAPAEIVVRWSGDELGGWAAADGDELTATLDGLHFNAARSLGDWLARAPRQARIDVHDHAGGALLEELTRHGFKLDRGRPWVGLFRRATVEPEREVPGYQIREAAQGELQARVEVHRAAWLPAALPYPPGHRPVVAPGATSSFTEAMYERVRSTWLYDPGLDLVAEASDGTLAASCIGWFDPATGVTEIEPLGVRPEHRRRGLAGALCLEVAARTAGRGGTSVFINTGPRAQYPAPAGAYMKVGFKVIRRGWAYSRRPS